MIATPKRERLIEAAKVIFYQQGVSRSTLADIAQQAQIPLGNIYYHFRTKEALVDAVIQTHMQELQAQFAQWEHCADPHQRLLAFLEASRSGENIIARYGCPHGSLCQELGKDDRQFTTVASQLFQIYLEWTQAQFRQLGKDEQEAKASSIDIITSLQVTFILANSFHSSELLEQKLQRLEKWVCSL